MITVPLFAAFAGDRDLMLLAGGDLFCLGYWATLVLGLWTAVAFLVSVLP